MLYTFTNRAGRLARLASGARLVDAVWIDLCSPLPEETAAVEALGVALPTIEEMEEIELSSRLYREGGKDYMTVVLPGLTDEETAVLAPVTFVVCAKRLVTVRYHTPRPFETFPDRIGREAFETTTVVGTFLALADEIIARFADILETIGQTLDALSAKVFSEGSEHETALLRGALQTIGRQGERLGRVRLGLLTMERALSFFGQTLKAKPDSADHIETIRALQGDIAALGVHADFVASRISLIDDATLGHITLAQNATVRIFSVVAVLFMPPTLVASIYGMNFRVMPELGQAWGYPAAIVLMGMSAALTYLFFKWKKWL
ncbi:MAG TPA: magnesium transporter [Rhodobacteraceae bacterium]|nr:magnesium transporter [Paracoccaceae bacterium]